MLDEYYNCPRLSLVVKARALLFVIQVLVHVATNNVVTFYCLFVNLYLLVCLFVYLFMEVFLRLVTANTISETEGFHRNQARCALR